MTLATETPPSARSSSEKPRPRPVRTVRWFIIVGLLLALLVGGLVGELPERERTILVLRFVHDRTQAEIGAELCISQMHVSRLLSRTLGLLRERVGAPADEPEAPAPVTAA